MLTPFYDPLKSYEENFEKGPFGIFVDGVVVENTGEPEYDFFGHKIYSPFGIAAGPLVNGKFVQAALDKGFDIVTYKTVRSAQYPCHSWPNVLPVAVPIGLVLGKSSDKVVVKDNYSEPLSITNSFGVPSYGPEFWQKDMEKVLGGLRKGQILVGAFQGTKREGQSAEEYINDFRVTAKLLKDAGVKVMEVNLSCPNEGTGSLLCYDVPKSVKVVRAIKEIIGEVPLIIKIGYYKDSQMLKDLLKEVGTLVEGISAINTISAEILDKNNKPALSGEDRLRSGVCGDAIKWAGLEMVERLKKLREELDHTYTIIGVGGVTTPEDFFEYRKAGADIVMSATGAMWNPYLAKEIKERLRLNQ